jgi:tetratricopeptide (TPR) repeat protein
MQKNSFFIFAIIISLLTLISNYKVFNANINQFNTQILLSQGALSKMSPEFRNRISTNYPTLTSTTIPFKSLVGTYWVQNDSIVKGLDLLREGNKDNPYLGFSDAMIAQLYDGIGIKDSFIDYARKAYNKLPNAPQHYVLISRALVLDDKLDSLSILFDQIKTRVKDNQVFKIYLAAILNQTNQFDSIEISKDIAYIKSKYPYNRDLNLLADYINYGQENVTRTIELKQAAIDSFTQNPNKSIETMEKILLEQNDNYSHFETLIEMYFRNNDFNSVIETHTKLQERSMLTLPATLLEFVSISYVNTNNINLGCLLAQDLRSYGYKVSSSLARVCDIKQ